MPHCMVVIIPHTCGSTLVLSPSFALNLVSVSSFLGQIVLCVCLSYHLSRVSLILNLNSAIYIIIRYVHVCNFWVYTHIIYSHRSRSGWSGFGQTTFFDKLLIIIAERGPHKFETTSNCLSALCLVPRG